MSELAPGIIAAIVVSSSVGVVLIVVLAVFIPRLQRQKELKLQYQQKYALKLQRKMKPLRYRGYPNLTKLTTATPSVTPSPTDSPTSRRPTSYDELDRMEKDMEGDESGEIASQVHEAFHAIKQVEEGNEDEENNHMPHVTVVSTAYDESSNRTGHMRMTLSATNSTTNSKGKPSHLELYLLTPHTHTHPAPTLLTI